MTTTKSKVKFKMPETYHYRIFNLILGKLIFQIWVERKWKKVDKKPSKRAKLK